MRRGPAGYDSALVARAKAASKLMPLKVVARIVGVHLNTVCHWRTVRDDVEADPSIVPAIERLIRG